VYTKVRERALSWRTAVRDGNVQRFRGLGFRPEHLISSSLRAALVPHYQRLSQNLQSSPRTSRSTPHVHSPSLNLVQGGTHRGALQGTVCKGLHTEGLCREPYQFNETLRASHSPLT